MIFLHEFESFESKNYQTEPGWKSCITLCRSWPTFRRCLRWMTISLTTRLEASGGKCVCMCVSVCVLHHSRWVQDGSVITGTALCLFSDAHAVKHTKTLVHAPMRAVLRLLRPETDTMSLQNICQSLSWNTDKTIPRERDKSPTRPRGQTRLALSETQSLSLSELRLSWASKPPV